MVISGIIRPPPDIRTVADRTALFVSKNGRAFEIKILNSAKGKTPKFAFLHDTSPFHAYYEDRIRFYDEGGTDEEEKKREEEEKLKKQKDSEERELKETKDREEAEAREKKKEAARKKASAVDPVARALLAGRAKIEEAKRASAASKDDETNGRQEETAAAAAATSSSSAAGPSPPPQLRHVSLAAPANLSPLEVEAIKLTAQFVALSENKTSGVSSSRDNFLSNLTLKEWSNPEFAFLQPRHGHFAYFTALVDGYRSFLPGGAEFEKSKEKARVDAKRERLAHLIPDDAPKDGATKQIVKKKKKDAAQECLETAAYRAEYEREAAERRRQAAEGADGLYGAAAIDWHDFVVVETIEFDADEVVEALPPPTSLRLAALNKETPGTEKVPEKEEEKAEEEEEMEESSSDEDADMEQDDDDEEEEDDGEKLKVVSNYQPKVVSTQQITGSSSRTHVIDPITGKSIAVSDMPEHMRIQLLDPKWAEEKKRFLEKQRETNYVAGEDIASNISAFARARGGILGKSEAEVRDGKVEEERRLGEANRLIREQAMMQGPQGPGMQPPPPPPHQFAAPPPPFRAPPPPTFAPPPPPPPQMAQASISSEEPAAKRLKTDDSQAVPNLTSAPPPPPPLGMMPPPGMPPGMAAPPPPGMPPGMAPPPPPPAAPSQTGEPLSEADFIATLSTPDEVPICIRIPHDPTNSNWNFNGQTIDLTIKATSTMKELKNMLKEQLGGMPVNKMQIKHPVSGFMNKDGLSLAHFNVGPMATLDLVPKTRGRARK